MTDPAHPLAAAFKPLIVTDEEVLEREAATYLKRIRKSSIAESLREKLEDVFLSWFEQRFKDKTKQEIEAMFQRELPELRETRSGQQLIEIGRNEGRKEGRNEGRAEGRNEGRNEGQLESLRTSVKRITTMAGSLTPEIAAKIDGISSIERLDEIELKLLQGTSIDELV